MNKITAIVFWSFIILCCSCKTKQVKTSPALPPDSVFRAAFKEMYADSRNHFKTVAGKNYYYLNLKPPSESSSKLYVHAGVFRTRENQEARINLIKSCFPHYHFFKETRYKGEIYEHGYPFMGNGYGQSDLIIRINVSKEWHDGRNRHFYRVNLIISRPDSTQYTWFIPQQDAYTPTAFDSTFATILDGARKKFRNIRGPERKYKDVNTLCLPDAQTSRVWVNRKWRSSSYEAGFYEGPDSSFSQHLFDSLVQRCCRHLGKGYQLTKTKPYGDQKILITTIGDFYYDGKEGPHIQIERRFDKSSGIYKVLLFVSYE